MLIYRLINPYLFLCLCAQVVNCQYNFGYSLSAKPFRTYSSFTINNCIFECRSRSKCKALKYDRWFKYCMLLDAGSSSVGSQTLTRDPKITYSEKEWWEENGMLPLCSSCGANQVCRDGTCTIEECGHVLQTYQGQTALFGNMVKLSSTVLYEYLCFDLATGVYYRKYVRGKCGADGIWDVEQIICYDVYDLVTYRGCFSDYFHSRILQGGMTRHHRMTIPMCASYCYNRRQTFFGLQYYNECFCGTSIGSTVVSNKCSTPCRGDSTTICGGALAMSVYRFNSLVTWDPSR